MKQNTIIALIALLLLATAAMLAARHRLGNVAVALPVADAKQTSQPASARVHALAATPQARAYRKRQAFERRIKRFLSEAPRLGTVERLEQVRALAAAVDDSARVAQMSAGEAFVLHAALIEASTADANERIDRMARLAERYRRDTAQREALWLANQARDPQFQDYKARERAIVAEVMALSEIPGGLSRDTYLRQRLQQTRERSYR